MADKNWKAAERAIAQALGGRRVGCTGRDTSDVESDALAVEVKTRKRLPTWLFDAMQQARDNARGERLPVVVLHQVGGRHDDDLVLLRLADFRAYFGTGVE
jgi:hypothetical protein